MSVKAKKYMEQVRSILSCVEKEQKSLAQQLSALDKEVTSKYHEIEMTDFNASKGYSLACELQHILRERRKVKNELAIWNVVIQSIDIKNLTTSFQSALEKIVNLEKKQAEVLQKKTK